jgi:periplasmic divalent cation tolerance protein
VPTIYATAPPEPAASIARTVVEEELAACVNRIDCESVYRWEGEIHDDAEEILLAKTTEEAAAVLVDRIAELHPYDVPCIERFDETDTTDAFGDWLTGAVGHAPDR